MKIYCPDCGCQTTLTSSAWRCDCGGAWEPVPNQAFDPTLIDTKNSTLWRYRAFYDLELDFQPISLGAGGTPLLPIILQDRFIELKPEYYGPTASFKDRGIECIINILHSQGVHQVVEDSSGNAGASVAAYAARVGMQAEIFVPETALPAKRAQMENYGAHVNLIPGPRANASLAALKAVESGLAFASHAYHPGFLVGQQSLAFELWEQMDGHLPDWYIVPVGQGGHLLGVWLGFKRLYEAGLSDHLPHMVGVQPSLLAPLCQAFTAGLESVPAVEPKGISLADGLAIARPVRGRRLLQAIRESKGTCVQVEEEEIRAAQKEMARQGFYIEPTSATAIAALGRLKAIIPAQDRVVIPLTGSGLKSPLKLS